MPTNRPPRFNPGRFAVLVAAHFVALYIPTCPIVTIWLFFASSHRLIYEDPLFGQSMVVILLASVALSLRSEMKESGRERAAQDKAELSSRELTRLSADNAFVATYASEGTEGDAARTRISGLLEGAGGWPNETVRLVFERADESRRSMEKARHNASLNEELRGLVLGDDFERVFFSPASFARSVRERRIDEILCELGPAVDKDLKSAVDVAYARRSSADGREAARPESIEESRGEAAADPKMAERDARETRRAPEGATPTEIEVDDEMARLDAMDGWEFETYCSELLKPANYQKVRVTSGSGDQGIDVLATKHGVEYGIQCKNYGSPVGNKAVQEAFAGKSYYGCHVAIVLTNSTFSPSAVELAKSTGVVL